MEGPRHERRRHFRGKARPGRIIELIPVDLPQPRNDLTREDERYFGFITRVRERLRGREIGRPGAAEVAAS